MAAHSIIKRVVDVAACIPALLLVVPLCLLLLFAIRIDSPGAPLLVQVRVGRGGNPFRMFKLRTMHARTGDNFAFLDKDTLYGDYSSRVMQLLTGDPHDRDSPTFLEHLREPEYEGLLATARENLEIGVNVVVCAPFSREVKDGKLFDPQAMGMSPDSEAGVGAVRMTVGLAS